MLKFKLHGGVLRPKGPPFVIINKAQTWSPRPG
jgi:hypothetical protein